MMNHQTHQKHQERPAIPADTDRLAKQVVDAAFHVHNALGPGLLESAYEACLVHELIKRNLKVNRQQDVPIQYDGVKLDVGFRYDLCVEDQVLIEIKSVDRLAPVHEAQVITYLKLTGKRLGFLVNFNVRHFRDGIQRIAN